MIVYGCILPHPPVLVPEVGGERLELLADTLAAIQAVAGQLEFHGVETLVVISPHGPGTARCFALASGAQARADLARFGAPEARLEWECDTELRDLIMDSEPPDIVVDPGWSSALDWGCSVPLYHLPRLRLVPISTSGAGPHAHFQFGKRIAQILAGHPRRIAVVASADLSHGLSPGAPSGFLPEGPRFDQEYARAIEQWDVAWVLGRTSEERRDAAEDAIVQTAFLMGAVADLSPSPRVLSYEGPFGVGYLVADLQVQPAREGSLDELHHWDSTGRFA